MKKKHRLSGPGNSVVDNLVAAIAARDGASCLKEPGGLWLSFPGKSKAEFIAYAPTDHEGWALRLARVEKQSAVCLLKTPILYRLKFKGEGGGKTNKRVLRLSVGLSLSLGPALHKRYTCVLKSSDKRARVIENGHLSLGSDWERSTLAAVPDWADAGFPKLAEGVVEACESFQARPEVQLAISALGEKRRTDLNHLDQLYRRKQGSNDRLYGLRPSATEGSVSIESELRMLQKVVLERYAVTVRLRILSLGIFEGKVPREVYEPSD